jgi:hypothetical protein
MRQALVVLIALVLCAPAVVPATGDDPAAPLRQFIDSFNSGNVPSAFAAYATGSITIVDEFAPHLWTGPNAAHDWADAYDKHAQATDVTDGKVTYGKPTRIEQMADAAYVVMPTVYLYKEHGKAIKEEGQITAVLNRESGMENSRLDVDRRQAACGAVANSDWRDSSRGIAPASRKTAPQNIRVSAM